MHPPLAVVTASVALLAVSACSGATTTPFARAAQDGAGGLSAAARAVSDLHAGRLTREYATTTLKVLASELETLPDELRDADGAPDPAITERLSSDAEAAVHQVQNPCLDESCDWRAQIDRVGQVANTLAAAAGP
jgi:hypothetical protein